MTTFIRWLRHKLTGKVTISVLNNDGQWVDITKNVKAMELAEAAVGVADMTSEEAFAEVIRGLRKSYPPIKVSEILERRKETT